MIAESECVKWSQQSNFKILEIVLSHLPLSDTKLTWVARLTHSGNPDGKQQMLNKHYFGLKMKKQ